MSSGYKVPSEPGDNTDSSSTSSYVLPPSISLVDLSVSNSTSLNALSVSGAASLATEARLNTLGLHPLRFYRHASAATRAAVDENLTGANRRKRPQRVGVSDLNLHTSNLFQM